MSNWTKMVVNEGASIQEVLKAIDEGSARIALVVDKKYKLIGTVTDGDIRRGLLKNLKMADKVINILNTNPITAKHSLSKEQKINILQKNHILVIPILDESNKLVGIDNLSDLMRPSKKKTPVCIMAGGFGLRLGDLTNNCPKPMLPVGQTPLLERLILRFIDDGFSEFFLTTHFMPEYIQNYFGDGGKWGADINYVHEASPLGTGGAIGLLADKIGDSPVIVINGDVLTNISFENLIYHHAQNSNDITICVQEREHPIPYGVVQEELGIVKSIDEKPTYRYKINLGIYVLNKCIVESSAGLGHIDMPTIIENNMKLGLKIGSYVDNSYWLVIGQPQDYKKAQNDIHGLNNTEINS